MDRLNTRNILKRKKHKLEGNNYNCVLCNNNVEETAFHLFFSCSFSQACWRFLRIHLSLGKTIVCVNTRDGFPLVLLLFIGTIQVILFQMMMQAKLQLRNPFFMEIFIIASWHIWKQRNNFIFDRGRPSFISWKTSFYEEAKLQAFRLSEEKRHAFLLYLDPLS